MIPRWRLCRRGIVEFESDNLVCYLPHHYRLGAATNQASRMVDGSDRGEIIVTEASDYESEEIGAQLSTF